MKNCPECGGEGEVDFGGFDPGGKPINVPCSLCMDQGKIVYLVTGDREWTDVGAIKRELLKRKDSIKLLVHGNCRGADKIAAFICDSYGIPVKAEDANWKRDGHAAGPIRNQKMLDKHDPDVILAFHHDLRKSKGTKNMVTLGTKHGCVIKVFNK